MRTLIFNLYLDESGEFQDQALPKNLSPSLVGGLLWQGADAPDAVTAKLPEYVHAKDDYKKPLYFDVLKELRAMGGRFVIFENTERIHVVNGDVTYLNIISEGIVKILQMLAVRFPDDRIDLRVLIAKRKDVLQSERTGYSHVIQEGDYKERLEEKLLLAMGRQQVGKAIPSIEMEDARYDKRLMLADIICNTYLTRRATRKFTDEERATIQTLFEGAHIFPVFDNATVGYLRRLYIDGRYEEMLYQICTLRNLNGVTGLRNTLCDRIKCLSYNEQKAIFSFMSLQIRQYNSRRMFEDGIQFAENYKRWFLSVLAQDTNRYSGLGQELTYWTFDTDFYILTMYDHLGNMGKCSEYLERCRANLDSVSTSWEHIDFYFQFKIRELNCLLGQFAFDKVISKSAELIEVLKNAKELFTMIGSFEGEEIEVSSELLGKVNGVRLEALINLLHKEPALFEEAIQVSDDALDEFSRPQDLQRQWQYRCMLLVEAGKPEEAISCLLKSYDLPDTNDSFDKFLSRALEGPRIEVFSIYHYSNVLKLLCKCASPRAEAMGNALFTHRVFKRELGGEDYSGYPWNMIVWNVSEICRMKGALLPSETYAKKALSITQDRPENTTMLSFAVSMAASRVLKRMKAGKNASVELQEYRKIYEIFVGQSIPESMRLQFPEGTTEEVLETAASAFLR